MRYEHALRCTLTGLVSVVTVMAILPSQVHGNTLFDENYASGATTTTTLTPSVVINGANSAAPSLEIESLIVNPDLNGGSNVGPQVLTFDPSAAIPVGLPAVFQSIDFDQPAHPNDPSGYEEITAAGKWWTDNPTTFFHQNASISLNPQLASREKVYVLEYTTGSNIANLETEQFSTRIGLFDDKDQGVYLGHNFTTRPAGSAFVRANQLNAHRINASGENVHIEVSDGSFSSGAKNLAYGQTQSVTPPSFDTSDFKLRGEDETGILGQLFQNEAVIRLHTLDTGRMSVEWWVAESMPITPGDPNTTAFGGSAGDRPEMDGWHNYDVIENIYDLSGTQPVPLGDLSTLRISMWAPQLLNGVVVSDLDAVHTGLSDLSDRSQNNHQVGFGRIAVKEYHKADINRDNVVDASDATGTLLANINTLSTRVWKDGDVTDDQRVTVADAVAGVLPFVAGSAPSGPQLQYQSGSGNLSILANGHSLSSFALVATEGQAFLTGSYSNPNPDPGTALETVDAGELSWMNLTATAAAAGSNLSGLIDLGAVMPTGLTQQEFEDYFSETAFNLDDALSKASSFFGLSPLPGDFNVDGTVNAADFTVWRNGLGTSYDQNHYIVWRSNYGVSNNGASATFAAPEPGALPLAGIFLVVTAGRRTGYCSLRSPGIR